MTSPGDDSTQRPEWHQLRAMFTTDTEQIQVAKAWCHHHGLTPAEIRTAIYSATLTYYPPGSIDEPGRQRIVDDFVTWLTTP